MSSTCLVALLLLGGVVSKGAPADDNATADNNVYKHLAVYSEVLSRIKSEYVEEPDMSSVTLGAMNGMLESIDPYASYLNAHQYKEYLKNYDTYSGDLGMVLAKKFGYITIVSVVPDSPADKAGLTTGDFIESIKGIATRDMPLAYANLLLKRRAGLDDRSFGTAPQAGAAETDHDACGRRLSAGRIEDDAGRDWLHQSRYPDQRHG